MTFVDGTTVINAEKMNGIVSKINEIIDKVNGDTPTPTVSAPSIFVRGLAIVMTAETGATIYYTTDGSTPTSSSTQYTGAFTSQSNITVKAIAIKDGVSSSASTASFTAPQTSTVVEPTIVIEGNQATLLHNGVGTIKYAFDSSTDYLNYTEPLTLSSACTIKTKAVGTTSSALNRLDYTGNEEVLVSQAYENKLSNTKIESGNSSTLVVNTSSASVYTLFYPVTNGRKYHFRLRNTLAGTYYYGYSQSAPSTVTEETTLTGKLPDSQPTPASGTTDQTFNVTAENYAYIAVCYTYGDSLTFGEILK